MVATALVSLLLTVGSSKPLNCLGSHVPPTGYRQYTEVLPASPGATNAAQTAARQKLIESICQGMSCRSLAAEVVDWSVGESDGHACAMAVVEEAAIQRWRSSLSPQDLDDQFEKLAESLFKGATPAKGSIAVVLSKVVDNNTPGGERAEWLRSRMGAALSRITALSVRSPPTAWAGDGVPRGFVAVVTGRVFSVTQGQEDMLEVSWRARLLAKDGRVDERFSEPMTLPAAIVPRSVHAPVADPLPLPEHDDSLSVQIASAPGGSLCLGQPTQLYLRSSKDQYVQVYDLYGADPKKALLIFPNEDQPSGFVKGGTTIAIGGKCGFQAFPVEGADSERFVALGSAAKNGFGALNGLKGYCRLKDPSAVLTGEGLPAGVKRAGDGYRIVTQGCQPLSPRDGCEDVAVDQGASIVEMLEQLPECAALKFPTAQEVK